MEKEANLRIDITIANVNDLTIKEKQVLLAIAGEVIETPETKLTEVIETPKKHAAVKPVKTITPKKEVKEEVITEPLPKAEVAEVKTEIVEAKATTGLPEVTNIETLNEYARMTVNAANGQHFKALLKEYNVKKFKDIPEDKVLEIKAKLDEIIENVVA